MSALTLARQVRELLAVPERWTQGWLARDANGVGCPPTSKRAVCWCLDGAMRRVTRNQVLRGDLDMELRAHLRMSPSIWNDGSTHADVLALLDRVVQRMERENAVRR